MIFIHLTCWFQDFFYICSGHLKDRSFCTPDADEVAALAAKHKQAELDKEIERVKQEYEEKKKQKEQKRKEKEKNDKDKKKSKDKDEKQKEQEEDKKDEQERDEKVILFLTTSLWTSWTLVLTWEDQSPCTGQRYAWRIATHLFSTQVS